MRRPSQQPFLDKFRDGRGRWEHLKIFSGLCLLSIVGVVGFCALASSEKRKEFVWNADLSLAHVLNVSFTKQSIKSGYKTCRAQTYLRWLARQALFNLFLFPERKGEGTMRTILPFLLLLPSLRSLARCLSRWKFALRQIPRDRFGESAENAEGRDRERRERILSPPPPPLIDVTRKSRRNLKIASQRRRRKCSSCKLQLALCACARATRY